MHAQCPKCGHAPLPADQALPATCPACGVVLAKARPPGAPPMAQSRANSTVTQPLDEDHWLARLTQVPERVDSRLFWVRVALWLGFALWGALLIGLDHRSGEMGGSFIHKPLLVFHEAGHVLFMPFGEWVSVLGGTLGQLLMPLVMGGALLLKNCDPFGTALALWLLGVSVLDVAPYVHDALHPQLMLLSGTTGENGPHDWVYLLSSVGWLAQAPLLGSLLHGLGALVIFVALAWAGWLLRRQHPRRVGFAARED